MGSHVVVDIGSSYRLRGARCRSTSTSLCPRLPSSASPSRPTPNWICSGSTGDFRSTGWSRSTSRESAFANSRRLTTPLLVVVDERLDPPERGERPLRREQRSQRYEFRCRRSRPASIVAAVPLRVGVQRGVPRSVRDLRAEQESGRRLRLPDNGRQRWRTSSGKHRARRRVAAGRRTGSSTPLRWSSVRSATSPSGRTSCAISAGRTMAVSDRVPRDEERDHAGYNY